MALTALELANRLRAEQRLGQQWIDGHFEAVEDGHYSAVAISDEECWLAPYPEFSLTIYRGQNQYVEPCLPSLHRAHPNKIERLIERIRAAEFQLLLSDHPAVTDFSNWSVERLRPRIDYEGLAQHYGLKTDLLDFTSNPLVAAFFACCHYDRGAGGFRPITQPGPPGIIYRYNAILDMELDKPRPLVVGLQPLRRPAEQYAWGVRLPHRISLNSQRVVSAFSFVHDPQVSWKIFQDFEGGAKLFPDDVVAVKTSAIASTSNFSREAFSLAMTKYGQHMKERSTLNDLARHGIQITTTREISFTQTEIAGAAVEWNNRRSDLISRIHWRRVFYP